MIQRYLEDDIKCANVLKKRLLDFFIRYDIVDFVVLIIPVFYSLTYNKKHIEYNY